MDAVWVIEYPSDAAEYPEVWATGPRAKERFEGLRVYFNGTYNQKVIQGDEDYLSFDDATGGMYCLKRLPVNK